MLSWVVMPGRDELAQDYDPGASSDFGLHWIAGQTRNNGSFSRQTPQVMASFAFMHVRTMSMNGKVR